MPSKDDLVARTKDLRIVGFGPTNRPVFTLRSLLATGDWSTVGLTLGQGLEKSRQIAESELSELTALIGKE
jgi:hypothetical protein